VGKEYGGKSAPTPREAARDCDFVMMCVGNDDDVRSVVLRRQRRLAGMKKGAILVDHTTASASVRGDSRRSEERASASSTRRSRRPGGRGERPARHHVRRRAADFDKAKPVIDVYAKLRADRRPGAGQLTKMVNQICIVGLRRRWPKRSTSQEGGLDWRR
jgi:3-hydroxyisobutyrate dehydrogenase-like beta-hydroxyacid dehydrogenase